MHESDCCCTTPPKTAAPWCENSGSPPDDGTPSSPTVTAATDRRDASSRTTQIWDTDSPPISNSSGAPVLSSGRRNVRRTDSSTKQLLLSQCAELEAENLRLHAENAGLRNMVQGQQGHSQKESVYVRTVRHLQARIAQLYDSQDLLKSQVDSLSAATTGAMADLAKANAAARAAEASAFAARAELAAAEQDRCDAESAEANRRKEMKKQILKRAARVHRDQMHRQHQTMHVTKCDRVDDSSQAPQSASGRNKCQPGFSEAGSPLLGDETKTAKTPGLADSHAAWFEPICVQT